MLFKSNFFRVLNVAVLSLAMTIIAFGDTIRLKDGSIIKGKIVSFTGGKFIVSVGDGTRQRQLNFMANEIESISFDADPMPLANNQMPNNNSVVKDQTSTVITVGKKTPEIVVPPILTPKIDKENTVSVRKPIEIGVKVLADNTANGWTNSGWVVKKGQRIRIVGSGQVSLGSGRYTTAGGIASLKRQR